MHRHDVKSSVFTTPPFDDHIPLLKQLQLELADVTSWPSWLAVSQSKTYTICIIRDTGNTLILPLQVCLQVTSYKLQHVQLTPSFSVIYTRRRFTS